VGDQIVPEYPGSACGFMAGFYPDDHGKINVSNFSGEEKDSGFLTATVQPISYDHPFNNSGSHRGWFLGDGFSSCIKCLFGIKLCALR
jgi:hypothetical protein